MTSLISWIPPATITALGWALLHFLWQGAAIAALAAGLMRCCRGPSIRYLIGVAALVLMLTAPLVTFFAFDGAAGIPPVGPALSAIGSVFAASPPVSPALPWLVEAWACGVALLGLRFAANLLLLEWRGQGYDPAPHFLALCREVQQRLGIHRVVRYLECDWLSAPAGFGALRPAILLPVIALTGLSEEQLRAVIAHELAHIRRWDFAVNLFQVAVEALLFYHPAVWWLNARIRAEREICCDEIAVSACGNPVAYARALTLLAEWRNAPAMAMAINRGPLTGRIQRLLGGEVFNTRSFVAGLAGSLLLLMVSLAGGDALLASIHSTRPPTVLPVLAWNDASQISVADIAFPPVGHRVAGHIAGRRQTGMKMFAAAAGPTSGTTAGETAGTTAGTSAGTNSGATAGVSAGTNAGANAGATAGTTAGTTSVADDQPVSQVPGDPQEAVRPIMINDEYPAPVLNMNASHGMGEWTGAEIIVYCRDYATQTVTQGANRPIFVDEDVKQRLLFFDWHCMRSNAQMPETEYVSPHGPTYSPVGAASSDHPVNVAGTWAISFSPFPASRSCTFTQNGNSLSGTCARSEGGGAAHGVVDGRQVRWSWSYLDDEKKQVELDFIGMVRADGTIAGQSIQPRNPGFRGMIQSFTAVPGAPSAQVASQ